MHIWIIEMQNNRGRWEPTVGAHLSRKDARREMEYDWQFNCPDRKFRITKYIAAL